MALPIHLLIFATYTLAALAAPFALRYGAVDDSAMELR